MRKFLAGVGVAFLLSPFIWSLKSSSPPSGDNGCCKLITQYATDNRQLASQLDTAKERIDATLLIVNEAVDTVKALRRREATLRDSLYQYQLKYGFLLDSLNDCQGELLWTNEQLVTTNDSLTFTTNELQEMSFELESLSSSCRQLRSDYFVQQQTLLDNQLHFFLFMLFSVGANIAVILYYRGAFQYS